jgi:choline dehydrogenase-like flavoprotein
MIVDARKLDHGTVIDSDLCVVGAGAAGITIAHALLGSPLRVSVLESGGLEFDERTQSLYAGRNIGFPAYDLDVERLRYFGGTTNHWAGHCRPLDPIDFERRTWLPHSGWPITRADLDPYYARAQPILELPPFNYDDLDFLIEQAGAPALPLDAGRLKSVVYNQSPPTRFGEIYRDELRQSTNATVYLHANVLELASDAAASRVTGAEVACIDGPRFTVAAKRYVLAMGGMEIPRLLLLSNKVAPAGLGNTYDLVGRFFMNHAAVRPAMTIRLSANDISLPLYHDLHQIQGGEMFAVLVVSEQRRRKEALRNVRMHVDQTSLSSPGEESLKAVGQALRRGAVPEELGQHLARMLSDLDGVTNLAYRRLFRTNADLIEQDEVTAGLRLDLVTETSPDPDSRITLTEDRDLFGQNRLGVDWRVADADLQTAVRACELAALEFGRLGLGRARGELLEDGSVWPEHVESGKHHCGTARMSDDPKAGVVDANCRVHGLANLYVAGSAVFPTIGYANPTLTIVALSLRLADHLKQLA